MSTPKRIQRKRTKGWRMPEGAVYVGRGSRWGNPFKVEQVKGWPRWGGPPPWQIVTPDGRTWEVAEDRKPIVGRAAAIDHGHAQAIKSAVDLFALHVGPMGNYEYDNDVLEPLRGRDLACWCPLDQPCHADVLLELANHPCGHAEQTPGCGGCDPGAIDAVYDEQQKQWRAFDPALDLAPPASSGVPVAPGAENEEGDRG